MNKNVLYVLLFVGLAGYYGYDQVYPEYEKWGTEIEDLKKNIASARANAPKLAEIRNEEIELKRRLKASLEKLPSASELADLLAMLTPLLDKVGIPSSDITSKNVDAAVEKDIYRVHPISMTGIKRLRMSQVVRLLYEIRQFHRIVNVRDFTLKRNEKDEYELDLKLETYSYIEAEGEDLSLDDVEQPAPAAQADTAVAPATVPAPLPVADTGTAAAIDTATVEPEEDPAAEEGDEEPAATAAPAAAPSSDAATGTAPVSPAPAGRR